MSPSDDSVVDDDFGRLSWDSQSRCWVGKVVLSGGATVGVSVKSAAWSKGGEREDRSILPACRAGFQRFARMIVDLESKAAADLLELYNSTWSVTGTAISHAEFISRLELQGVALSPSGGFEAYFDTDDLFTDHAIRVPLDDAGKMLGKASLEG
jgi:hypothetical protein